MDCGISAAFVDGHRFLAGMAHPGIAVTILNMRRSGILIATCLALGSVLAAQAVFAGPRGRGIAFSDLPATDTRGPGPGMFLVARRALDGSHFGRTVVYLVEHDEDGTLGLIVNRASDISLSEAVPDIENEHAAEHALYYGGPVGLRGIFILLRSDSASRGMAYVADDVYISSDRGVLDAALAAEKDSGEVRFYLGHSGWSAGQLDSELERGSWHVTGADTDAVFSAEIDSLWDRLIERLEPEGIQVETGPLPTLSKFERKPFSMVPVSAGLLSLR